MARATHIMRRGAGLFNKRKPEWVEFNNKRAKVNY
jgi:hypothetical protein